MDIVSLRLKTDSEKVTFDNESFVSLSTQIGTKTYTLPDGREFSTSLKPYALGYVGSNGVYDPQCFFTYDFNEMQAAFNMNLMLMPNLSEERHRFLGGQSDFFSFIDLDVKLAPDIEAGVYHIGFVEPTEERKTPNIVTQDITVYPSQDGSKYVDIIPTLKGCNIWVGKKGDVDGDGQISADDASKILVYAAKAGSEKEAYFTENGSEAEENFCYSLASLTGETPSATDAAHILTYAAMLGAGENPDWDEIVASGAVN